ncbi:MAG: 5'-nucleotidase C-terminal domain-containing protein [Flavobacteriia bacterium]|nr:5'-nucleotidase C-terminal domain-containing protein [Flavobacteriia bacterium]
MRKLFIFILIGAGLSACSFGFYKKTHFALYEIENNNNQTKGLLDSIIYPYKTTIDKEMDIVIGNAKVDFVKNRPNGNLNNLIADIIFSTKKHFQLTNENVICVQNFGGIRSSINKGDITIGTIYSVLPFENFVFAVKLPKESISDLIQWYKKSNGHPIAGAKIVGDELIMNNRKVLEDDFWVITNDYLFFGGDNALFFNKKFEVRESTLLLREVVIDYIKNNPVLLDDNKERLKF